MAGISLLVWCIPCLFFLSFLVLISMGPAVKLGGSIVSGISSIIAFILALLIWIERLHPASEDYSYHFDWFIVGDLHLKIGYEINNISAFMLLLITFISMAVHLYLNIYLKLANDQAYIYPYISLMLCSLCALVLADNLFLFFVFSVLTSVSIFLLMLIAVPFKGQKSALTRFMWSHALGYFCFLLIVVLLTLYMPEKSLEFTLIQTIFNGQVWTENSWIPSIIGIFTLIGISAIAGLIPCLHWQKYLTSTILPLKLIIFGSSTMMLASYMFIRLAELIWTVKWIAQLSSLYGLIVILICFAACLMTSEYIKRLSYVVNGYTAFLFIAISYHAISFIAYQLMIWVMASIVLFILFVEQRRTLYHRVVYIIASLSLIGLPPLSGFWFKQWLMIYASERGSFAFVLTLIALLVLTSSTILMLFGWSKERTAYELLGGVKLNSLPLWLFISIPFVILIGFGYMFVLWAEPMNVWITDEVNKIGITFAPMLTSLMVIVISIMLCWFLTSGSHQRLIRMEHNWLKIEQKTTPLCDAARQQGLAILSQVGTMLQRCALYILHWLTFVPRKDRESQNTSIMRSTAEIAIAATMIAVIFVIIRGFLI